MIKAAVKRFIIVLMLGLSPWALKAVDLPEEMKILADSAQGLLGNSRLPALNAQWMEIARELNDTTQMEAAYDNLISHYYRLGDIDSLKEATYEYMDWCTRYNKPDMRYMYWRQYIQRVTEKGMQEEAIAETARLHQDAEQAKSKYGLACSEMCIGYNHRIFANNVEVCIEYYNYALKHFEEGKYYRDVYVVLLNIIQTYLSRNEYVEGEIYLNKLEQLETKLRQEKQKIDPSLHLRFSEFRVICMLASRGKIAAEPYIKETDNFYRQNPESTIPEAWFAYKIMCCRILGDLKGNIAYVDSLMAYQHSLGICYPYNHRMKAELQAQLGDYRKAYQSYTEYAQVNDSVRKAEQDELLSKYTAKFEVDKLKMEKLELSAKLNKDKLTIALIAGSVVLILLLVISYLYIRTLSMNRKLDAAHKAVKKMSKVKSSFIQHITHEIRTPLNSIVGFSTLLAEDEVEEDEKKEYAAQVESNNTYLLGLIENILTMADMDSLVLDRSREEVDISICCQECAALLHPVLKEEVILECIPSSETFTIYTVRPWLKLVMMALLDNAVKFTNEGYIRVSCKQDKVRGVLDIIVEDTGIGIKPENKKRIFERFYKVDTFIRGTGLGLAIVQEIMDMVGGRVYLDETYRKGCRFVLEWPMREKTEYKL